MLQRFVMVLLAGLAVVGCSQPEVVETPFEGPGWDEESGTLLPGDEDGTYMVGLTFLRVKNAPGPGKRFGELAGAIGDHVYGDEPAGFVAGSFRNIGKLQWWTMTVWESEDDMVAFMVDEPHITAMTELADVAAEARSTHLEIGASELPFTWDRALDELADVTPLIAR